jgi:MerR family transcriptional regulator, thiopeptide resistance regulator
VSEFTVGSLARLAHVSIRTLHHYDATGLLVPSGRRPSGYCVYTAADLQRLRRILFYRELDFGLPAIRQMLADPDVTTDTHLRRQHQLLRARIAREQQLLDALEKEMEARQMGISLTPEEQFEIFGTDQLKEQMDEAGQRWGQGPEWQESKRRTATYSKADWLAIKAEADASTDGFAQALKAGLAPDSDTAMDLAEAHRQHISRWFYECGLEQHVGLGELYVSDPRFIAEYDKVAPGFSEYVRQAIRANARRKGLALTA